MTLWDRADRVFTHQTVKCLRRSSKITQCSKKWLCPSLNFLQLDIRNPLVHLAFSWAKFQVSCRQTNIFLHTTLCELPYRYSDSQTRMIPSVYAQIQYKISGLNKLSIYSKIQHKLAKSATHAHKHRPLITLYHITCHKNLRKRST